MVRRSVRALGLLVAVAGGLLATGCGAAPDPWRGEAGSPRVVVTIAPLASFVRGVGGDRVAVRCLCTTTGPHHYSDEGTDARLLRGADLFLALGLTLDEHFAEPLQGQSGNARLRYTALGDRLPLELKRKLPTPIQHGDHTHDGYDPHVWLGVEQARALVVLIRDELVRADPDHAAEYRTNATAYGEKLAALEKDGRARLAAKKSRRILTQHDSLHYFARSFGLEIAGVIQVTAGDEPTDRGRAALEDLCVRDARAGKPVAAISIEPQYARDTAAASLRKALAARGVEVALVSIDPLETADAADLASQGAGWYLARMRANLQALEDTLP